MINKLLVTTALYASWTDQSIMRHTDGEGVFWSQQVPSSSLKICRRIVSKSVSLNGSATKLSCSPSQYMVLFGICHFLQ